MSDHPFPRVPKWPFLVGDVLLLGVGALVLWFDASRLTPWHYVASFASVACGAWLLALPFVMEYRAAVRLAEASGLASTMGQLQQLEVIAERIGNATALWQTAQDQANRTVATAKEITERIVQEAHEFGAFMQKAGESERSHLRLENEKLRRNEAEWLQVTVRMLDHVFALFTAALRSGQPQLIEQLGHFQNACRDAARRVGLSPFAPASGEPFDPQKHQLVDADSAPAPGSVVAATMATGFTFQGQLLRRAMVSLSSSGLQASEDLSIRDLNEQRAQAGPEGPVAELPEPAGGT